MPAPEPMNDQTQTTKAEAWRAHNPPIPISARLYEELKDYFVLQNDMEAGQLLRRLREAADDR